MMHAVVFDIDGTLIESLSVDERLYRSSITDVLGPVSLRDLHDYEHVTDSGILAEIIHDNALDVGAETIEAVKSLFVERLREHVAVSGAFPAIGGAISFFETLRQSGDKRVAIATGGWRASALIKLESAGFNINGVPLVTSDDSPRRVEIMQAALDKAGQEFSSVTYFGDALWDERACRQLGWTFVPVGPALDGIRSFDDVRLWPGQD